MLSILTGLSAACTFVGMSMAIMDCKSDAPMPTHAPTEIVVIKGNDAAPAPLAQIAAKVIVSSPYGVTTYEMREWALRTELRAAASRTAVHVGQ